MAALPLITQTAPAVMSAGKRVTLAAGDGKVILFYPAYEGPAPGSLLSSLSRARAICFGIAGRLLYALLGAPIQWRFRNRSLFLPRKIWLAHASDRVASRRSLIAGVPLPARSREVC